MAIPGQATHLVEGVGGEVRPAHKLFRFEPADSTIPVSVCYPEPAVEQIGVRHACSPVLAG